MYLEKAERPFAWSASVLVALCGLLPAACSGSRQPANTPTSPTPQAPQAVQVTGTVLANGTNLHELSMRAAGTVTLTVTWTTTTIDLDLYLTDATCAGLPVVECTPIAQSAAAAGTREQVTRAAAAGQRYRVWIDNDTVAQGTAYTLELSPSTAGDLSASLRDFLIGAETRTLSLARSCGSKQYFVAPVGGFNAPVTLACQGLPPGATCRFSPNTVVADPSGTVIGMTLAVDPALAGTYRAAVQATGGGVTRETSLDVTATPVALPPPRSDAMTIVGCAGYEAGARGSDSVHEFANVRMMAVRRSPLGVCTDGGYGSSESSGWFVFTISNSSRCSYPDGGIFDVYLDNEPWNGGLPTCVSLPFTRGTLRHMTLLGRRGSC